MQSIKRYILLTALVVMTFPLKGLAEDAPLTVADSLQERNASEGVRFSLLTCTPGTDAYAHFGHTAILAVDERTGKRDVYNYGCFDSSQKNFVLNFIKGDTNYLLEAESERFFLWRYSENGNGVTQQELNLTEEEALRLKSLLEENVRPENQTYLYNWLYDNCTERARDVIAGAVGGTIVYERKERNVTAREMLHEKLRNAPWLCLGIDLLLGEEIDTVIGRRTQMFIPDYYKSEIDSAVIVAANGERRPLVKATSIMLEESEKNRETPSPLSPVVVFSALLFAAVLLSAMDVRRRKSSVWFDMLLHTAQGLAGIVIAYLFFFSKHPAVDSNWQVVLFNPLALCYAAWMVTCAMKGKTNRLAIANLAVCLGFVIIMLTVRQSFHPAVWLMALTLLVRSIVNLPLNTFKRNK